MLYLAISWIIVFLWVTLVGCIGLWSLQRILKKHLNKPNIFEICWLGIAIIVAISQSVSIFSPLNTKVLCTLMLFSMAGVPILIKYFFYKPSHIRIVVSQEKFKAISYLAIVIFLILYMSSRLANREIEGYDTLLYHLHAIKWMNEFPAVPGLGNLHSRLAMNSGFLILAATIDNAWWESKSAWVLNGFILVLATTHWLFTIVFSKNSRTERLYALLTLPYLLLKLFNQGPNLHYDTSAHIILMIVIKYLIKQIDKNEGLRESDSNIFLTNAFIISISALAFSFKQFGAVTLLLISFYTSYSLYKEFRKIKIHKNVFFSRTVLAIVFLPALIIGGHLTRNIIQTGWVLYPAPILELNVDWAMPRHPVEKGHPYEVQSVSGHYEVIKAWAKLPGTDYHLAIDGDYPIWFNRWFSIFKKSGEHKILLLSLLPFSIFLACIFTKKILPNLVAECLWALATTSSNLVFWFLTAPDLRFGDGFIWSWFALVCSLTVAFLYQKNRYYNLIGIVILIILLTIARVYPKPELPQSLFTTQSIQEIAVDRVSISDFEGKQFEVNAPMFRNLCGDAPIPCTPYPLHILRQRKQGSLRNGYNILNLETLLRKSKEYEITSESNLGKWEGPYPQWGLLQPIRWVHSKKAQLTINSEELEDKKARVLIKARSLIENQNIQVIVNGVKVADFQIQSKNNWILIHSKQFYLQKDLNRIELLASKSSTYEDGRELSFYIEYLKLLKD